MIQNHPDQFLQLLSEEAEGDAPAPPGAQEVFVTEEERDAIDRVGTPRLLALNQRLTNCSQLCRLGFSRDMVIQAYFACDKNEELAANFLFDQPQEEDEV